MSEESAEEVEETQEAEEETSDSNSSEYKETSKDYSTNNSSESEETSKYNSNSEESDAQEEEAQENQKENLESRLKGTKSNIVEKFYSKLKSKGYSKEEIAELLADKESLYAIENLPNSIRSLIYLIEGFLENGDIKDRDVYKRIDESEGTVFLFFPGLMRFPYSTKQLEENTGLNIIRVDETDPDEIEKIVDYAANVSGQKPGVIGYSDGRIEAEKCSKFKEKISEIFVIAGNKTIENIVYIDGGADALAPFEKGYHIKIDEGSVRIVLPGMGHVDMVYNPIAIQKIGEILRAYTRVSSAIRPPEANNTSGSYSEANNVIRINQDVSSDKAYSKASNVIEMPNYIEMRKAA